MACLRVRISDRSVLKLILMWLRAPVIEEKKGGKGDGKKTYPKSGTPQGGVISPLLANIYLHWFDKMFHRSDGPASWANARLVRYADDFVILARYQGYRLQEWVRNMVEDRLSLRLNREKTRIVKMHEEGTRFDFLGFTFRYDRCLYGREKRYLDVFPSKKSINREREKLREMTQTKYCFRPIPALIQDVNRHLFSWSEYYDYGYPRVAFRSVNQYVRRCLCKHLRRRSQRRYQPPKGISWYRHLKELGLTYL